MPLPRVPSDPILPLFAMPVIGCVFGRKGRLGSDEAQLTNRVAMTVFILRGRWPLMPGSVA